MLGKGTGEAQICADNLLRTGRFSVPYERIKGIKGVIVDSPANFAKEEIVADAEWVLETYEPRVRVNDIEVTGSEDVSDFHIIADISIIAEDRNI